MDHFISYKAKFGKQKSTYKIPVDVDIIENLDSYRDVLDSQAWKAFKDIFNSNKFVVLAVYQEDHDPFISTITRLKSYGQHGRSKK